LAGVSVPTVSKVVNGRAEVAPQTRLLVEQVIREHGYRRQRKASASSALIELVFHELIGAYPLEILRGVERVAGESGLAVVVSESQGRQTPGKGWIEGVLARRPAGVIAVFSALSAAQRTQLSSREIPLVMMDPTGEPGHEVPSVLATNWSGGLAATRHLIELGHRRIAAIAGPDWVLCSRARLDGYRAALDQAGIPADPLLVRSCEFFEEEGQQNAIELLQLPDPPTAIFALNDGLATGVYNAVADLGLRIPQDVSVVGFDDLPLSRWLAPPLTTIHQPLQEMGAAAARMVLGLGQGIRPQGNRLELATELIIRNSTGACRR
jgi:LacI family transcriptional regulator, xylobiose transport system transcriptional regulator